ncbi:hypothetical protein RJ639_032318 [Escallonia herrerae]|uniref:Uncharacterized protein n=1 Tax=Escallonia herrerae TaxID=1293975 RepID=A0AA88WVE6_9ASTE|nr:hypothetical protein RJ639_032318 [Escallonia herrerae]
MVKWIPLINLSNQLCKACLLAWSGVKPSVGHLRVFGNVAYAHVPDQERSKHDDRSKKYVFIGYDSSSKGYKLYNPNDGKIMVSRDVVFDEEGSWNWNSQDDSSYDFFPYPIEKDHESEAPLEPVTPPSSLPHPNEPFSSEGSNNPSMFDEFKDAMVREIEMTNMGLMSYYLGLEVKQMKDGIFMSQESYAKEVLKKFKMLDSK